MSESLNDSQSLNDKVAVVTGAGVGIGRGVAMLLADEGVKVIVNDPGTAVDGSGNDQAAASQVVDEIRRQGGTAAPSFESVTTMEGGERIIRGALEQFGKLDIVVTCHGILRDRMIYNMTEEEWDDVVRVHLKGTFTVVRHACSHFVQRGSGRIITFSSLSGLVGNSGQANYGAAKDGIAGFTRAVAVDMGHYGVTANCIAPSAHTRMIATVPQTSAQRHGILSAEIPAVRGQPEDIAPFVAWLASDQANDVNGNVFYVTNGLIALLNNPVSVKSIHKSGRWNVEELIKLFPATLGMELPNPAPPAPPQG